MKNLPEDVTVPAMVEVADYPNRLRVLREAAGKSPLELALALGVSADTVRRLEKPEETIPSKYIPALARLVNTDERHLMGWDQIPANTGGAA